MTTDPHSGMQQITGNVLYIELHSADGAASYAASNQAANLSVDLGTLLPLTEGGHEPAVYPASSSDYTGSIFETFETETWDPTKINPDSNYMSGAGLGEAANSGNPANQHSELQEQFIADIVQGVIADELLDYKETLQFAETAPGNGSSGHPLYVETDGDDPSSAEDIITLVEQGYYVQLKGQLALGASTSISTAISGSISAIAVFNAIQSDETAPVVSEGPNQLDITYTTPLDFVVDILPDIV